MESHDLKDQAKGHQHPKIIGVTFSFPKVASAMQKIIYPIIHFEIQPIFVSRD